MRVGPGIAALAVLAAVSTPAVASPIAGADLKIRVLLPDGDTYIEKSDQSVIEFFNLAHCVCGTPFQAELHLPNADTTTAYKGDIWLGTDCDTAIDAKTREAQCETGIPGGHFDDIANELRSPQRIDVDPSAIIAPVSPTCNLIEATRAVYFLVDDDNTNDNNFLCVAKKEVPIDADPPPEPDQPTLVAGESSLLLQWNPPTSRSDDVKYYQALCSHEDGSPVEGFNIDPQYETARMLCNGEDGTGLGNTPGTPASVDAGMGADAGAADAGPTPDAGGIPADGTIESLDPMFLCGTAGGTDTSLRIQGLENGITYRVVLLSIDNARNVTAVDMHTETPKAVEDFWEDYKDKGGGANGGVCLITTTYGDDHPFTQVLRDFRDDTLAKFGLGRAMIRGYYWMSGPMSQVAAEHPVLRAGFAVALLPLVGAAWVWERTGPLGTLAILGGLLLLATRRRRRRRRQGRGRRRLVLAAAAAGALLVILRAGGAHAQTPGGYEPYWENWDNSASTIQPVVPLWNAEIKVGPYLPSIDNADYTLAPGEKPPFEEMFRNKTILFWNFELQRFFLFPEGQLGATASAGFMGVSANSLAIDSAGNVIRDANGVPERAPGNKTRFRMMPFSVGAVYRFTALDDRWGIPVIPYGKLGLSYYLWWVRDPNDKLARAQKDAMCDPTMGNCPTTRALGASIGWQGSVGIDIRAERLDPSAELGLRNELGIEHAGFFIELLYANVDHFGAKDRLNVGDTTWQAGISFEF